MLTVFILYLSVGYFLTVFGFVKQYEKNAIWTYDLCWSLKVFLFIIFMIVSPIYAILCLGEWGVLNIVKCFRR